jgi:hypothetical protein
MNTPTPPTDTDRLNWLETHPFMAYRTRDEEDGKLFEHFTLVDEDDGRQAGRRGIVHDTLRECIDEAILFSAPIRPEYQQRVLDEKAELDKKANKLSDFIGMSPLFESLDPAEQERLKVQNDIMWQYSEVLGARIAAF